MSRDKVFFLAPIRSGGWRVATVVEHGKYHDDRPASWRGPYATKADARNAITANPVEPPVPNKWLAYTPAMARQSVTGRIECCTCCGQPVSLTPDWTLWPWPDGAALCARCNDKRHEEEEYP